jgi:hypothetical protein
MKLEVLVDAQQWPLRYTIYSARPIMLASTYYSPGHSSIALLITLLPAAKLALSRVNGRKSLYELSYVYPVKSCRGFKVNRVTLTRKFLTIRELPEMVLIKLGLTAISAQMDMVPVAAPGVHGHPRATQSWLLAMKTVKALLDKPSSSTRKHE